jgi:hypothetical protein
MAGKGRVFFWIDVCICVYICVYICEYIYTYIFMYIYVYIYACFHTYTYISILMICLFISYLFHIMVRLRKGFRRRTRWRVWPVR